MDLLIKLINVFSGKCLICRLKNNKIKMKIKRMNKIKFLFKDLSLTLN